MKFLFSHNDWNANDERRKRNAYGGTGYYRIMKIAEMLKEDHDVTVVGKELTNYGDTMEEQWDNIFKEFDVFWTTYFYNDRIGAAVFYHAEKHGKKVVIDCDDDYLAIDESNPVYDQFKEGARDRAFLSAVLSLASVITVSTEPLKKKFYDHFKKLHGIEKEIVVVPNMNDVNDWKYDKVKPDKFTIGYSGSTSHLLDFKMIIPALVSVMKKYPHIYFETIGIVGKDDVGKIYDDIPQDIRNRMGLVGATATFEEYPEWLGAKGWDIGIAPLLDTAFTRGKSHIKWMEYSMFEIPTIASRVYPYFMPLAGREIIRHNETGMLARNNQWEGMLEDLILDEAKRRRLGKNAYNFIKENWQYDKSVIAPVLEKL
jgi:glycosyltransferase involved in cell wall biosynthesis